VRTKEEIVASVGCRILNSNETDLLMYVLEVLLDIRDLLSTQPKSMNLRQVIVDSYPHGNKKDEA
jgi:hypothetical protein